MTFNTLLEDTKPQQFSRFLLDTKEEMSRMQFQHFNRENLTMLAQSNPPSVKGSVDLVINNNNQLFTLALAGVSSLILEIQFFPYP